MNANIEQDEHGETFDERGKRLKLEYAALRSDHPDGLSMRIARLLAGNDVFDIHADGEGDRLYPPEHQMARSAASILKAITLAIDTRGSGDSTSVTFEDRDVVRALGALACYLDEGADLMADVRCNLKRSSGA